MRKIAVIGAGVAGLLTAHGLLIEEATGGSWLGAMARGAFGIARGQVEQRIAALRA